MFIKKMTYALLLICGGIFSNIALAEDAVEKAVNATRAWRIENDQQILSHYMDLLSRPNFGGNINDIRMNAKLIMEMMNYHGIKTQLLELEGSPPSIYGERLAKNATKTVLFYVHYDGQPAGTEGWATHPFEPVIRDGKLEEGAQVLDVSVLEGDIDPNWRIYARSASDDKAPIIGLLAAIAGLEAAGIEPSVNLKFFFEGEEEIGSPHLFAMTEKYKELLKADYILFLDGPQDQRGNARVILGVRGVMGGQIVVYGPSHGLHSGHYGNFAPNPVSRLAHLLSSMRDDEGHILIDHFYDHVAKPSDMVAQMIATIPNADEAFAKQIGVGEGGREYPELRYEETHLLPALNFLGISGGGVGNETRNVVLPEAQAAIGIRLVPNLSVQEVEDLIDAHIRKQGYFIVREDPDMATRLAHAKIAKVTWSPYGYEAFRTEPDEAMSARLIEITQEVSGGNAFIYPALGGSLPLSLIAKSLNAPLAILPIANFDNNQHAANENIRIGHLWKGIELYGAIIAGFGD